MYLKFQVCFRSKTYGKTVTPHVHEAAPFQSTGDRGGAKVKMAWRDLQHAA